MLFPSYISSSSLLVHVTPVISSQSSLLNPLDHSQWSLFSNRQLTPVLRSQTALFSMPQLNCGTSLLLLVTYIYFLPISLKARVSKHISFCEELVSTLKLRNHTNSHTSPLDSLTDHFLGMLHLIGETIFLLLFVFLINLVHHHHPALVHRHVLIMDRLLTFLMAFSTLVLKPSFSLHSHLSLAQTQLLESDHSVSGSHWRW